MLAGAESLELAARTQRGTDVNTTRLPDKVVLDAIVRKFLTGNTRKAIIACARRSLGDARDQRAIRVVAQECGADPRVVLAAFGFLPDSRQPEQYVDVWQDDETTIALLSAGTEMAAAFALSRAVHPEGGSFVEELGK